ncbi:META domain-containing protein [Chroococcus sp. FPU101]|uniref:META domain-containing protein n=1 Tax=Chroococcus sp. FPU101 TaxID=1974212 RepID=UPI001A8CBB93|nr:META domain-containing protein [Chroococcus sp. FPU101]GFE71961.1 hypothetical protein CFPU101_45710 [Chroococcus sp. FPU101]
MIKSILGSLLIVVANGIVVLAEQPPLQGTPWKLQSWSDVPSLVPDIPVTITFEQSNLSGSAGCNRYRTAYETKKQNLTIKPEIASTFKACPEDIMRQEALFLSILPLVERFDINAQGELKLTYRTKKGTGTLIFTDAERPTSSSSSKMWLDHQNITNWNQPKNPIPQAPKAEIDANLIKQCQEGFRRPTTPEDNSLSRNGWMLFGPIQSYAGTTLITATSNVDGMCRPLQYQAFIFVDGQFAGTLSPQLMDSRTDGSTGPMFLTGESNFSVEFNRYLEKDALCCPSGVSRVSYQIQRQNNAPIVVPIEVATQSN